MNSKQNVNSNETTLDFSNMEISTQEKYVYQFYHQQLDGLEDNQIHIHGVKLDKFEDGFAVRALLRHSLKKKLLLETVNIVVKDDKGIEIAKGTFDMDLFGTLEPLTARPWKFFFKSENLLVPISEIHENEPFEVLFEYHVKVVKDFALHLDENWNAALNDEQVTQLTTILASLEPLPVNEISVVGFNLAEDVDRVNIYVLIRNSFNQTLTIDNLPIQLYDAQEELVGQLGFPLGEFQIPAKSARPISISFPKSTLSKQNPDLSHWMIQLVPQS